MFTLIEVPPLRCLPMCNYPSDLMITFLGIMVVFREVIMMGLTPNKQSYRNKPIHYFLLLNHHCIGPPSSSAGGSLPLEDNVRLPKILVEGVIGLTHLFFQRKCIILLLGKCHFHFSSTTRRFVPAEVLGTFLL